MTSQEKKFLAKRQAFVSSWPILAIAMLAVLGILLAWLFIRSAYLANPFFVANALKEASIAKSTMELSTIILPILVWVLFISVIIFVLYGFAIISNEKKYLAIINNLQKGK